MLPSLPPDLCAGLFLAERQWNMWIPGFGSEEIRPYKKACTTEAHKQVRSLQNPRAATAHPHPLSCVSEGAHTATVPALVTSSTQEALLPGPKIREGRRQQGSMGEQLVTFVVLCFPTWGLSFFSQP